ncbi:hypothetical protein GCM10027432_02050 [Lysobacter fragariae]
MEAEGRPDRGIDPSLGSARLPDIVASDDWPAAGEGARLHHVPRVERRPGDGHGHHDRDGRSRHPLNQEFP